MIGAVPPRTWIIGRGGLLGGAVSQALAEQGGTEWEADGAVPWSDERMTTGTLSEMLCRFCDAVRMADASWQILWCAGAGVVATAPEALAQETRVLATFVAHLQTTVESGRLDTRGGLFLASSAGGVYAGSPSPPPFHEESDTGVLSAYGAEKLAQEALVGAFAAQTRVPVLIGRISNIYGPGQDASKPQGLITQIGLGALARRPVQIYVSLDTIRDYIFAADAASIVLRAMQRLRHEHANAPAPVVKVIASGIDTTIASVLGAWRQVLKRPPGLALAASPIRSLQPARLSFRSLRWPDLGVAMTPLPVGIHAVFLHQLESLRLGTMPLQR